MPSGREGNKTPAVRDEVLQPMLAAALHLVQILGPHVCRAERADPRISTAYLGYRGHRASSPLSPAIGRRHHEPAGRLHQATGTPLPMLEDHDDRPQTHRRLDGERPAAAGLHRDPGSAGRLRPDLGDNGCPQLREPLIEALSAVGVEKIFARNADRGADRRRRDLLPWTLPLHRSRRSP